MNRDIALKTRSRRLEDYIIDEFFISKREEIYYWKRFLESKMHFEESKSDEIRMIFVLAG
jgi:hypothetical protein